MNDVTRLIRHAQEGDPKAAAALIPLVYDELRRLAAAQMARQPPNHTLQATALVHEAWLKLAGKTSLAWADRQHFFRAAAEAMRHILVDHARARRRLKRGGAPARLRVEEVDVATETQPEMLLMVDEALCALERSHPENAELVKLRFYIGMSVEEAAGALGIYGPRPNACDGVQRPRKIAQRRPGLDRDEMLGKGSAPPL